MKKEVRKDKSFDSSSNVRALDRFNIKFFLLANDVFLGGVGGVPLAIPALVMADPIDLLAGLLTELLDWLHPSDVEGEEEEDDDEERKELNVELW